MIFDMGIRADSDVDPRMLQGRLDASFVLPLSQFGQRVQARARSSIRKSRRMRPDELSPIGRKIFESRMESAQHHGTPLPVLPFAPAKPGEPPHSPSGILPRSISVNVDSSRLSTVVGPVRLKGGPSIPRIIEQGGKDTFPHPYMVPSLEAEQPKFLTLFEGCLS